MWKLLLAKGGFRFHGLVGSRPPLGSGRSATESGSTKFSNLRVIVPALIGGICLAAFMAQFAGGQGATKVQLPSLQPVFGSAAGKEWEVKGGTFTLTREGPLGKTVLIIGRAGKVSGPTFIMAGSSCSTYILMVQMANAKFGIWLPSIAQCLRNGTWKFAHNEKEAIRILGICETPTSSNGGDGRGGGFSTRAT